MSDEQPKDDPIAQTGVVREIAGPNGGALRKGGRQKPTNPTLADCNELARKRVYQRIPAINRIATNSPKKGSTKGRFSVTAQIAAFAELRRLSQDRTISESALREALRGMTDDIRRNFPDQQSEAILSLIAPWFLTL